MKEIEILNNPEDEEDYFPEDYGISLMSMAD